MKTYQEKKNKIVASCFCLQTLTAYSNYLMDNSSKFGIKVSRVGLPKIEKKITVLKSPHVFKKSKEQFKFVIYKTLFILRGDQNNIQSFLKSTKYRPKTLKMLVSIS